jgi:hypothetical protein
MYLRRELLCNLWWWPLNLLRSWLVCELVWNPSWFHGLPGYTDLSLLNHLLGGYFSYLISYKWSVLLQTLTWAGWISKGLSPKGRLGSPSHHLSLLVSDGWDWRNKKATYQLCCCISSWSIVPQSCRHIKKWRTKITWQNYFSTLLVPWDVMLVHC